MVDPAAAGTRPTPRVAPLQALAQFARVRPAAVAGVFYPADAAQLRADVERMLRNAADQVRAPAPKAIIAPHAGYIYSGETAARAYARLASRRGTIRRVVLLGPAHRVHLRGIALPEADAFDTPLGLVAVDQAALADIAHLRQVVASRPVHAAEHSLEVHLPFLYAMLGAFSVVPLVVGETSPAMVAEVLDLLWGGEETLIVVSSDLSHYHAYRDALRIDSQTVALVLNGATNLTHQQACGATPVNALMQLARSRRLRVELIDQCNSGDTAGPRDRVVGYASFALYAVEAAAVAGVSTGVSTGVSMGVSTSANAAVGAVAASAGALPNAIKENGSGSGSSEHAAKILVPQWFPADGGAQLVNLARASIAQALGARVRVAPESNEMATSAAIAVNAPGTRPGAARSNDAAWLDQPGATFVTLTHAGVLRGCIGSLAAHRALRADVIANAEAAAFRDPRFAPLTANEWPQVRIEVSLLTAPQLMTVRDEADALAQLRPHQDGVILEAGAQRATFLPQVWEQIAEPRAFLAALKQKAGLPLAYWGPDLRLSRYGVAKFSE